jgi:HEAT repeat protein
MRFAVIVVLTFVMAYLLGTVQSPAFGEQEKEALSQSKTLSEWIAQLKDPSSKQRQVAAKAIGEFGPMGKSGLQPIMAAVKDADEEVRSAAITALNLLPPDPKVVPLLAAALTDESIQVRLKAAEVLSWYLLRVPEDAREPAKGPLLNALKDPVPYIRAGAAHGLGWLGKDGREVIPPLVQALEDKTARVRCSAASSLGNFGPEARRAVPLLLQLLKPTIKNGNDDELYLDLVRRNAATALGRITRGTDVAVRPLCDALTDEGFEVGGNAVIALGDIGPAAKGAIEALRSLLENDKQPWMRIHAAASLARIDPKFTKSSVALLVKALKDERSFVRHNAVDALRDIGPPAKEATAALTELLKDKEEVLASRAARALRAIDPEAAKKSLKP